MENGFCMQKIVDMEQNYPFLCSFQRNIKELKQRQKELGLDIANLKEGIKKLSKEEQETIREKIRPLQKQSHIIGEYLFYLKRQGIIDKENTKEQAIQVQENKRGKSLYRRYQLGEELTTQHYYQLIDYLVAIKNFDTLDAIIEEMKDRYENVENEKEDIYKIMYKIYFSLSRQDKKVKEKIRPLRRNLATFKIQHHNLQSLRITHDYLYDIVLFLIKEPNGYNFLQKLFQIQTEFGRDIVNIKNLTNRHIFFAILELLKESCLLELQNQTSDYIKKESLAKIIQLYCLQSLKLSEKEKEECHRIYNDLLEFIRNNHYKEGPKMIQFLLQLGKQEDRVKEPTPVFYPFYGKPGYLTKTYTIGFEGRNITEAYSASMLNNHIVLKFHTLDVDAFIKEDTELDSYFKKQTFLSQEIKSSIFDSKIGFQKEYARPSITYKAVINGKGEITSFDVYSCMVKLDEIVSPKDFTLDKVKQDENLWIYYYAYYFMKNKMSSLEETIRCQSQEYARKIISSYFEKSGLPCVYQVQETLDNKKYQYYMNHLSYLFGKIDRKEAILMRRVLLEGQNFAYYDTNAKEISNCHIPLNPLTSYPALIVQRLVKEYLIRNKALQRRQHDNEAWGQLVEEVVTLANQHEEEKRLNFVKNN